MAISDWRSFEKRQSCSKQYFNSGRKLSISLRQLFPKASFVGCADIKVSGTRSHCDQCQEGDIFAALPGFSEHGATYVHKAIQNGANSILVEQPISSVNVRQCVVRDVRSAYAELCAELSGRPANAMSVVGVTGTNGKTTVTWLVRSILEAAEKKTGLLGTIHYSDGKVVKESHLTTPATHEFVSWLSSMSKNGVQAAAVELSSHALDQKRVAAGTLDVAVVTNVTQDHFDYHGGAEAYLKSKVAITRCCKPGAKIILNKDDHGCQELRTMIPARTEVISFGIDELADVSAEITKESLGGTSFLLDLFGEKVSVQVSLIGKHNVSNCLAAAASAYSLGISLESIKAGLEQISEVPGRLQRVDAGQSFDVFVDYAHTDDALKKALHFLQLQKKGRLICLCGAGGDRDRTKRPLIGQAVSIADIPVITSDNPRTEDPRQIIEEVLAGVRGAIPYAEVDREKAIQWSLNQAEPGDCVLIAGKGHEKFQEIQGEKKSFCDVSIVKQYLEMLQKEEVFVAPGQHAA